MSKQSYQREAPYFDWLKSSASHSVKQELRRMEQSKQNSFRSAGQILKGKYGYDGKTSTKGKKMEKIVTDLWKDPEYRARMMQKQRSIGLRTYPQRD